MAEAPRFSWAGPCDWMQPPANRLKISHMQSADRRGGAVTYSDSGVDIDAGNALVEAIKPIVRTTRRPGADAEIGGFGGLFDLMALGYRDPVLVAAPTASAPAQIAIRPASSTRSASPRGDVRQRPHRPGAERSSSRLFRDRKAEVGAAVEIVAGIAKGRPAAPGPDRRWEPPRCRPLRGKDLTSPASPSAQSSDAILPSPDIQPGDRISASPPRASIQRLLVVRKIVARSAMPLTSGAVRRRAQSAAPSSPRRAST